MKDRDVTGLTQQRRDLRGANEEKENGTRLAKWRRRLVAVQTALLTAADGDKGPGRS